MKKSLYVMLALMSCLGLVSCGEEEHSITGSVTTQHDSSSWFTDEELAKVGLSGLTAPTGCEGTISTDVNWFNNGYAFSQPCSSESLLEANAPTYLSYFETHYEGKFGLLNPYMYGKDATYYYIEASSDLAKYKDTNPSPLYKFYYVRDTDLAEDGYLKDDAVWSLDIRYEENSSGGYFLKIFIESEKQNHSGSYTYKFKIK